MKLSDKWLRRFWELANQIASWSKDHVRGVGAVLVSPDMRQVSWGFNGFPQGIADRPEILHDPMAKLAHMVHAELNAILNARRDVSGWTIFVTQHPCHECAKAIIQAGLARVVCPEPKWEGSKWHGSHREAVRLLEEAGVLVSRPPAN